MLRPCRCGLLRPHHLTSYPLLLKRLLGKPARPDDITARPGQPDGSGHERSPAYRAATRSSGNRAPLPTVPQGSLSWRFQEFLLKSLCASSVRSVPPWWPAVARL